MVARHEARTLLAPTTARPRSSRVLDAVSRSGVPEPIVAGVRLTVDPGRGRSYVPTRSVLVSTTVVVIVLVTTIVFGANLQALGEDPEQFGWRGNAVLWTDGGYGTFDPDATREWLAGRPEVEGWRLIGGDRTSIDGRLTPGLVYGPSEGVGSSFEPVLTDGRAPATVDEVAAGRGHPRGGRRAGRRRGHPGFRRDGTCGHRGRHRGVPRLRAGAGDSHRSRHGGVDAPGRRGLRLPRPLRGRLQRRAGRGRTRCRPGRPRRRPRRLTPGRRRRRRRCVPHHPTHRGPVGNRCRGLPDRPHRGPRPHRHALGDADPGCRGPPAPAADLGVYRCLGFTPRQLRASITAQGLLFALAAVAVGTPVGIALGRELWRRFADVLGTVPGSEVPWGAVALAGAGVVVTALLSAVPPAVAAGRRHDAELDNRD